jgi:ribosomal protein L35AE/L33A
MANLIDNLHVVFTMCGINNKATRANIIMQKGFTQLEEDVSKMAKRMAMRTQAEGRVLLGTVMIKHLQTLIWWVRDQQKCGLTLNVVDFEVSTMNQASEMKTLLCERAKKEHSITDIGKFDLDDFNWHEDAFLNLLTQSFEVLRESLCYSVHPEVTPAKFATMEEERMYQFRLTGGSFELDNQTIYQKLKAFLIDLPGWAWIGPHDTAEDSRTAYMAWTKHNNGKGELSKRTSLAKSKLESLHYKNK